MAIDEDPKVNHNFLGKLSRLYLLLTTYWRFDPWIWQSLPAVFKGTFARQIAYIRLT
jgi:hypothetical protein